MSFMNKHRRFGIDIPVERYVNYEERGRINKVFPYLTAIFLCTPNDSFLSFVFKRHKKIRAHVGKREIVKVEGL